MGGQRGVGKPGVRFSRRFWLLLGAVLLVVIAPVAAAQEAAIEARTSKPFEDVLTDLEFAATERNFRIVGRTHIGQALIDGGVPGAQPASVISMCNIDVARELLAADPDFIRYMPCRVAAYVDDEEVMITTLLLPEDSGNAEADAAAARLNAQMREIVRYGAGE